MHKVDVHVHMVMTRIANNLTHDYFVCDAKSDEEGHIEAYPHLTAMFLYEPQIRPTIDIIHLTRTGISPRSLLRGSTESDNREDDLEKCSVKHHESKRAVLS